jgi:hypothetical protein
MRLAVVIALLAFGAALTGCSEQRPYKGPTVESFTGHVTQNGKRVSVANPDQVSLKLILLETGKGFGIPLEADGSFNIGWMPIGKYTVMVVRRGEGGPPAMYNAPEPFIIEDGKTQYTIELGSAWKP